MLGILPSDVDDPVLLWKAIAVKDAWKTVKDIYLAELGVADLNPYSLLLWSGPGADVTRVFASVGMTLRALTAHGTAAMPPWTRSGGWLGTGDARMSSRPEVDQLVQRMPPQISEVDVMNAPHHGSRNNSSVDLYNLIPSPPGIVVTPADGRRWGHPHAEVLSAALEAGHAVIRVGDSPTQRFVWSVTVRA